MGGQRLSHGLTEGIEPGLAGSVSRSIRLTLKDVYGVSERVFEWNLR